MKNLNVGRPRLLVTLAATVFLLTSGYCCAAEALKKTQKLEGIVTEVTPASLTLDRRAEAEVTVHTAQDYSEWISVGMRVTAWYHEQEGILKLDRVDYPLEFSFSPPADFIPRIKKIILLPSSNVGEAGSLFDEVEQLFRNQFDWIVAHRMLAEEVRRRALTEQDVTTPMAGREGQTAPAPLVQAEPELIRRIADGARADAVLEVRVEYFLLNVKSHTAEWDGQRETFGSTKARFASAITLRPVRGQVPVATVVLKLYDSQGDLLWRSRRGFRVLALQVSMGNEFRDRPLSEAVEDSAFTSEWLHQVFASWLATLSNADGATPQR